MGVTTTQCFVVSCDTCGRFEDPEGIIPHYESEDEALNAAADYDYTVTEEGAVYCEDCRTLEEEEEDDY